MIDFPTDGGTYVDIASVDGYAVVAEPIATIVDMIKTCKDNGYEWIGLTSLEDPDEELPRRPAFFKVTHIVGLTYMSPDQVVKFENEIS